MLRRASAAVWICCCFGLATIGVARAEEFSAVITKIDGGKVVLNKVTKGQKAADATALPVADNVIVARAAFDPATKKFSAGEAVDGGLKNEIFSNLGEKGLGVRIVTDADDKITHILVVGGRKKKEG
jgi:hypothetical protein